LNEAMTREDRVVIVDNHGFYLAEAFYTRFDQPYLLFE